MGVTTHPNPPPWSVHPKYAGCLVDRAGRMVVDCTDSGRADEDAAALALLTLRAVNTFDALKATLRGLIEAVESDAAEMRAGHRSVAALGEARHALQLAAVRTC